MERRWAVLKKRENGRRVESSTNRTSDGNSYASQRGNTEERGWGSRDFDNVGNGPQINGRGGITEDQVLLLTEREKKGHQE